MPRAGRVRGTATAARSAFASAVRDRRESGGEGWELSRIKSSPANQLAEAAVRSAEQQILDGRVKGTVLRAPSIPRRESPLGAFASAIFRGFRLAGRGRGGEGVNTTTKITIKKSSINPKAARTLTRLVNLAIKELRKSAITTLQKAAPVDSGALRDSLETENVKARVFVLENASASTVTRDLDSVFTVEYAPFVEQRGQHRGFCKAATNRIKQAVPSRTLRTVASIVVTYVRKTRTTKRDKDGNRETKTERETLKATIYIPVAMNLGENMEVEYLGAVNRAGPGTKMKVPWVVTISIPSSLIKRELLRRISGGGR